MDVGRKQKTPDVAVYSGRVAVRLRSLREERNWSVEKLAAKLKLPVQTIYNYEQGKRTIPPDLYPDLADAFGLSVRGFLPAE